MFSSGFHIEINEEMLMLKMEKEKNLMVSVVMRREEERDDEFGERGEKWREEEKKTEEQKCEDFDEFCVLFVGFTV